MENSGNVILCHPNKVRLTLLGIVVIIAEMIFILAVMFPIMFDFGFFLQLQELIESIYIESALVFIALGVIIIIFGYLNATCPVCDKNIYFYHCKEQHKKYKHVSIIGNAFKSVFKRKIVCSCCNTTFSLK